jgi:class 3 adenylate cyclase
MALFPTDADAAVRAAVATQRALVNYNKDREKVGYEPIRVGVGLNRGL